jgi:hypothetical protein
MEHRVRTKKSDDKGQNFKLRISNLAMIYFFYVLYDFYDFYDLDGLNDLNNQ